jgi:TonB-dependent SusC/RagA subfamily outer membrane receptor
MRNLVAPRSFPSSHVVGRPIVPHLVLLALVAGCVSSGGAPSEAPVPKEGASTVTSQDIERAPSGSIERLLMSKDPALMVIRDADGGLLLRIRGGTSIQGNNEPLFIVDGVPTASGPGGSLVGINPYDIATIKVLKNAADLTMYGARGANGVIVIKTKRSTQ